MWGNVVRGGATFLLQQKSQSARGASHHSGFIGNFRTITHTFYSPIYLVDERNGEVNLR